MIHVAFISLISLAPTRSHPNHLPLSSSLPYHYCRPSRPSKPSSSPPLLSMTSTTDDSLLFMMTHSPSSAFFSHPLPSNSHTQKKKTLAFWPSSQPQPTPPNYQPHNPKSIAHFVFFLLKKIPTTRLTECHPPHILFILHQPFISLNQQLNHPSSSSQPNNNPSCDLHSFSFIPSSSHLYI